MSRVVKHNSQGFTLIELMLSMSFIAVLLLAIAMTVIQISHTYNRGMLLKEVNQTARSINDDIRRSIAASQSITFNSSYIVTPTSGRLCLGQVSYLWNTEKGIIDQSPDTITYESSSDVVRLVKVPDSGGMYCSRSDEGVVLLDAIRAVDREYVTDLLKTTDYTLALHRFQVLLNTTAEGPNTGQQLFTVQVTIGVGDVTLLNSDQSSCLMPGEAGADPNNCFVQQFSLVSRTGDRVN